MSIAPPSAALRAADAIAHLTLLHRDDEQEHRSRLLLRDEWSSGPAPRRRPPRCRYGRAGAAVRGRDPNAWNSIGKVALLPLPRCDSGDARAPSDDELARVDVVPMHWMRRVRPSGASVGRPERGVCDGAVLALASARQGIVPHDTTARWQARLDRGWRRGAGQRDRQGIVHVAHDCALGSDDVAVAGSGRAAGAGMVDRRVATAVARAEGRRGRVPLCRRVFVACGCRS